jgi:hypothetical protein
MSTVNEVNYQRSDKGNPRSIIERSLLYPAVYFLNVTGIELAADGHMIGKACQELRI